MEVCSQVVPQPGAALDARHVLGCSTVTPQRPPVEGILSSMLGWIWKWGAVQACEACETCRLRPFFEPQQRQQRLQSRTCTGPLRPHGGISQKRLATEVAQRIWTGPEQNFSGTASVRREKHTPWHPPPPITGTVHMHGILLRILQYNTQISFNWKTVTDWGSSFNDRSNLLEASVCDSISLNFKLEKQLPTATSHFVGLICLMMLLFKRDVSCHLCQN